MPSRKYRAVILTALAGASLAVSGCAYRSTLYQPIASANPIAGGYSDQRMSEDRCRASLSGNTLTSREQVETYLLVRRSDQSLNRRVNCAR